jgi:phospholipase C
VVKCFGFGLSPPPRPARQGAIVSRAFPRTRPGSRVPAIIVSPFAKRGHVDHTLYDTTSILRFITRRFGLPNLQGITIRDAALQANGSPTLGDLTNALDFPR